jgi:hypothetical protein
VGHAGGAERERLVESTTGVAAFWANTSTRSRSKSSSLSVSFVAGASCCVIGLPLLFGPAHSVPMVVAPTRADPRSAGPRSARATLATVAVMPGENRIGEFLRARRQMVRPADVGLAAGDAAA